MKELKTIVQLTDAFGKLPGVGPRTAERMAYAVLNMSKEDKLSFIEAIKNSEEKIHKCPECGLYTEEETCEICRDENRDHAYLCVVASPKDALAIEKMGSFNGIYHILGGLLSASKGISVDDLSFGALLKRIDENKVKEVVIATNPTLEGETTALFIAKLLEKKEIVVTRLGYGLPMGASLDYADSLTLSKAFEGRKRI